MKLKAISILLLFSYMAILCHNMVPHSHNIECRVALSMFHNNNRLHQQSNASHQHPHEHHPYHSHNNRHQHNHPHDQNHSDDLHHRHHHSHNSTQNQSLTDQNGGTNLHYHNFMFAQYPTEDTGKGHSHGFPLHHHGSPSNEYDYLRLKTHFAVSSVDQQPLLLFQGRESENSVVSPFSLTIRYYDYPFLIRSRFEPGAISLRGPPSIA